VIYVRDGVNYSAIMSTPQSNDELQTVMLARKVGMSQVLRVEEIKSLTPSHQHTIVQYAVPSEH
jgi:transcriptional antiterminator Rof (Rho-off)